MRAEQCDDATRQGLFDYLASQVPLGRLGEPSEIVKVVAFLASDEAPFLTGQVIVLDGGTTLGIVLPEAEA